MMDKSGIKLIVDVGTQKLQVLKEGTLLKTYPISTAALGVGEERNSFKTPRGFHQIRAKIGANAPLNSVFVSRRPTGEIYSQELSKQFPGRDWMLTRILWLSGLEVGKNRLGNCDTMRRYIYIHGAGDESTIGTPASHGCIRMKNLDIIELFDWIPSGTKVEINE